MNNVDECIIRDELIKLLFLSPADVHAGKLPIIRVKTMRFRLITDTHCNI